MRHHRFWKLKIFSNNAISVRCSHVVLMTVYSVCLCVAMFLHFPLECTCVLGMGCVCVLRNGGRGKVIFHLSHHLKGYYVQGPVLNVDAVNLKKYKGKRNPCLKELRVY